MSTFDESLHPRGQAANAGQFRTKSNDAPAGTLASDDDTDVIRVPFRGEWVERGVVPPRARKPRDITHVSDLEVHLRSVDSEDAPVGFDVPFQRFALVDGRHDLITEHRPARIVDGQLYMQVFDHDDEPIPADDARAVSAIFNQAGWRDIVGFRGAGSEAAVAAEAQDEAGRYIAVDGDLWRVAGEPVYRISTTGLGANHGATSLSVEMLSPSRDDEYALEEFYFAADERDAAVAEAVRVATRRGDTHSIKMIEESAPIRVSGEFAPGSTFRRAPRIDYVAPSGFRFEGDPDAARREFDRFKSTLMTVPGAVVEVDDGWGGMTKTVNRRALTERQAADYDRYVQLTATVAAPL
ncbi:MAG: hypothetical protein J0J04_04700 [Microbacterium sp.]|uniref:hypothetical protein n=1 Tax=Microbacterium sp. TaxID=51671 RepID=UPI001AD421CD|nr:hypothetical protein [Microbacterium sp.]MBN9214107.1 hypothetical protein [Microbacterium sp.]